ncbi:MAG: hypothetical protein ACYCYO_01965 [Bacilli bacterium]
MTVYLPTRIALKGRVTATVLEGDRIVQRVEADNTATDWARAMMASMLTGGNMMSLPTYIALGNGTGIAQPSNQWMNGEIALTRKPYSYRSVFQVYTAQITVNYQTTDPDGTFTTAGLWDGPSLATTLAAAVSAGATTITVPSGAPQVYQGESIYLSDGANSEYATLASTPTGTTWTLTAGLQYAHAASVPITVFGGNLWALVYFSGSGVTKGVGNQLVIQWSIYHVSG